jgi:hypothetical protein
LAAAVIDPLDVAANNSTIVVVPKKYSAFCLSAIINSRISRYYAFLTLRSAILLRKRTTWFPRAINALRMPSLTPKTARALHNLACEATELSGSVKGSEAEVYAAEMAEVSKLTKAGFLGVRVAPSLESIDREELAAARVSGDVLRVGDEELRAPSSEVLELLRVALLATEEDEFAAQDLEDTQLPADASVRHKIAKSIRNFAQDLKNTQERVFEILEEIDEIVAAGLKLTPAEHETIRKRCQEFPLSVTVERPRFAWSADRTTQARRTYRAGERFKT